MAKKKRKNGAGKTSENQEFLVAIYLFLFLFLGMMVYFVYFQAFRSEEFINSPYNSLQDMFSERIIRGDIVSADGYVLATTKASESGKETRDYPYGRLFAHAVGFASNGKAGIESQENFSLLRSHEFFLKRIVDDLRDEKSMGDTVVTTLDYEIQKRACDALGNNDGAVIVMEPASGKVIAMVSKPDFNPNMVEADWDEVTAEGSTVLFNRATQGKYAPGSVFKIFTTLEYYNENREDYKDYHFDCTGKFTEDGQTIHCSGNTVHGGESLEESFARSCNASYASMGLSLDISGFQSLCDRLLFNKSLPIAFESGMSSFALGEDDSTAMVMETAIGQGKTLVSPLHMVLVAAAISNDGILMSPYLIDRTENAAGVTVKENAPKEYERLLDESEAALLKKYMASVVTDGTAGKLKGQSYKASGKTGTAQVSDSSDRTNAWFVGYASKEGYEDIAVAVIVEDSGSGSSSAVPVAKQVFDLYFNR